MKRGRFNKQQSPSYIEHMVELRLQRVMVYYINVRMQCGRSRSITNISTSILPSLRKEKTCKSLATTYSFSLNLKYDAPKSYFKKRINPTYITNNQGKQSHGLEVST